MTSKNFIWFILFLFALPSTALARAICDNPFECSALFIAMTIPQIAMGLIILGGIMSLSIRKRKTRLIIWGIIFGIVVLLGSIDFWYRKHLEKRMEQTYERERQSSIEYIQHLPFKVYKVNDLPADTKLMYAGMQVGVLTFKIQKDDGISWAVIEQMKVEKIRDFPNHCPSGYYKENWSVKCNAVGESKKGHNLYVTDKENIVSLKIDNAVIVIHYFRNIESSDLEEIKKLIDSFTAYEPQELKKLQEKLVFP